MYPFIKGTVHLLLYEFTAGCVTMSGFHSAGGSGNLFAVELCVLWFWTLVYQIYTHTHIYIYIYISSSKFTQQTVVYHHIQQLWSNISIPLSNGDLTFTLWLIQSGPPVTPGGHSCFLSATLGALYSWGHLYLCFFAAWWMKRVQSTEIVTGLLPVAVCCH